MNTLEKNKFDAILALQEMTWKRMNARQGVEWKMSISLWTALSIIIGTVITGRISILQSQVILIYTIVGIAIIGVLYILNLIGMWKFLVYESALINDYNRRLLNFSNTKLSETTDKEYSKVEKYYIVKWYLVLRIGITLILLLGTVLAVYIAGGNNC